MRIVMIVADSADWSSQLVARALAVRAPQLRTAVLTPGELALAKWNHTLHANGCATSRLTLPRWGQIDGDDIAAVWYRAAYVSVPQYVPANANDRDYASAELFALTVSWLRSLGTRCVNRPDGASLVGPMWSAHRWLAEALHVGVPIARRLSEATIEEAHREAFADDHAATVSPANEIRVIGDNLTGCVPAELGVRVRYLAERAGCRFLGARTVADQGGVRLTEIDTCASLRSAREIEMAAEMLVTIADS